MPGTQYRLRSDGYQAAIDSIGASLRVLRHEGRDLVLGYDADRERPAMRGALLAPWPNRTTDGRYDFGGRTHQLPLNEPVQRTAAHGLIAWQDFSAVHHDRQRLVLESTIAARDGYPWRIGLEVAFSLSEDGLRQAVTATNLSQEPAPFGLGWHPYAVAGPSSPHAVDRWWLQVPAGRAMLVSERMLPTALVEVGTHDQGALDFRRPRRIGPTVLNNAFGDLEPAPDGRIHVRLTDRRGLGVELDFAPRLRWVQLYTSDLPGEPADRSALAVEPMTCPPDALNSGLDLEVLQPGGSMTVDWRLRRLADQPLPVLR
jgi:aldose 1-epimerase